MKTKLFLIYILFLVFNTSCFVTKYTHSQVMDMAIINKSEGEILDNFGIPDEKKTEGFYKEWFYHNLQERTVNIVFPSASDSVTDNRVKPLDYLKGVRFPLMRNTYLKITFQNGKATSWTSTGVNYSLKKISPSRTVICILASLAATIGLTILYANAFGS